VNREQLRWESEDPDDRGHFGVANGAVVTASLLNLPPASSDRLYLVTMAGYPGPELLYSMLSSMGLYHLNPERIREPQPPDSGKLLAPDGSNLTAVFKLLARNHPDRAERLLEYLRAVVPNVESVRPRAEGRKETLEFLEQATSNEKSRRFPASSMSDGTLRALGVLIALFQRPIDDLMAPVCIEEPEIALHPAAAGVLMDCLREAALERQVLVTSHSPDLLDRSDIPIESLLAVSAEEGRTHIGSLNTAGKRILKRRLRTAGELLRMSQIEPDRVPNAAHMDMRLF